jgi:hypothetical protein
VVGAKPLAVIVTGSWPDHNKWTTILIGDDIGATPAVVRTAGNFNWDGLNRPWRAWLILPMTTTTTALSGTGATYGTSSTGSYTEPGQLTDGVWVPATSGVAVNSPFITITGLTGMSNDNIGQWLTLDGSGISANNGTFPIVSIPGPTYAIIANPNGVVDATPQTWEVVEYPWIGPGPCRGASGVVYGQGEMSTPPIDTGSLFGGVWQPSTSPQAGSQPSISWGLTCSSQTIDQIRRLVRIWKSASTYYPNIIVSFDGDSAAAGSSYSPNSTPGSGNPDGTFGPVGSLSGGVWGPTRLISSPYNAYCQGTGSYQACSVENLT